METISHELGLEPVQHRNFSQHQKNEELEPSRKMSHNNPSLLLVWLIFKDGIFDDELLQG